MTLKNKIESRIRGWFPQTPYIGKIINTENNPKTNRWFALPFSTLGALMIAASLISAVFGVALVSFYLMLPPLPSGGRLLYSAFGGGMLSLAAFAVGLYSGILLLARKQIPRAITGICVVLTFGLATLLLPVLEGINAQSGLFVSSPMVVFSVAALCIIGIKNRNKKTKLTNQKEPPTIRERIFAGLAAGGSGLIALGILFSLVPIFYPKEEIAIATLVIGIPLLMAAFYIKLTATKSKRSHM